jgi:hypothetical protein
MALFSKRHDLLHIFLACLPNQSSEERGFVSYEFQGLIVLFNLAFVKHQNLIIVNDSVEPMGDGNDGRLSNTNFTSLNYVLIIF